MDIINCIHSFRPVNTLKSFEHVCKDHGYWGKIMPEKHNSILKFNQEQKCLRKSFVIYADRKSLPHKITSCHNNLEESYLTNINIRCVAIYYTLSI